MQDEHKVYRLPDELLYSKRKIPSKKVHELTDYDPLNDDDLARLIDWINETDET